MIRYTSATVAGLASLLSYTPLVAAEDIANEPTEQLDKMVVTAAGFEQSVADAPASISVITRDQLENKYYRDVTDALKQVPGVIVTGGGDKTDISIRGMGANYTLILVDGKRQSSRETRPNSDGPGIEQGWLPPLAAIDRIEVVRGPMSTLYGSDAIGGVINIITRKVADHWHGQIDMSTVYQENRDSGDIQQGSVYLAGPLIPKRLGLQLHAQSDQRDEDEIEHGYADKSLRSGSAKLDFTPNEQHDIAFETGVSKQDRRNNLEKSAQSSECRGPCEDSVNEYNRRYVSLSHTGQFSFGTTDSYIQREETDNKSRDMNIKNLVAKTSLVMPLGDHMTTLGAEYEKAELTDESSNQLPNSDRDYIENSKWAAFIEDDWQLTETFAVTAGLRMDDDDNFGEHYSPRLYGRWQPVANWTLKGGVSTGYKSPSLRAITPDWGQVSRGGNIYGNPDLEPETSTNTELGVIYSAPNGLNGSVTVFHNDFDDKITRVTCPEDICTDGPNDFGSDPTYRINVDKAVTQGVELSLSAPLSETLDFTASYTYTDSEQKSGEYEGQPLNKLPEHLLNTTLDWQATERFAQWTRITFRGRESQPVEGPSSRSTRVPSYTFVDTGFTYQLTDQARLKAGIYNLFDKTVDYDNYGYIEDGRRYWLGLTVDI